MKRILITGANSYVGTNVERWLMREPDKYQVDTLDMIDGSWREKDFSGYDVVFHVAGIAHVKETRKNRNLFFTVNRDLAIEVAKVSKVAGVSQFIFLSSMNVYGLETGVITRETVPNPKSSYGKSKLQAEEVINALQTDNFNVTIVRPPMVYGENCKGNFPKLVSLVRKISIFPNIHNQRSVIYIKTLCEFIKVVIENESKGLFFPQNKKYFDTTVLVREIAIVQEKGIIFANWMIPFFLLAFPFAKVVKKMYGNLVYSMELSDSFNGDYQIENQYDLLDIIEKISE